MSEELMKKTDNEKHDGSHSLLCVNRRVTTSKAMGMKTMRMSAPQGSADLALWYIKI